MKAETYRMNRVTGRHTCPVCGYPDLIYPPQTLSGMGSHEICPSCGFEFGFTDLDKGFSHEEWRRYWRAAGFPWMRAGKDFKPEGWDPRRQLADLLSLESE